MAWIVPHSTAFLIARGRALFELGRYDEAEAVFTRARIARPDAPDGHEGAAWAAEKLRRWDRALEAWTAANRAAPDRKAPMIKMARALLELRRAEEAETIFAEFCKKHPADPAGFRGLERSAEQKEDWPAAFAAQEEIWKRFRDPDAMRRKVLLLVRLDRVDEARVAVEQLRSGDSTLPYLLAAMVVLEATHDWAAMDDLRKSHETVFLENWELLHTYLGALGRLGRADEALLLLQRSRAGGAPAQERQKIVLLIQARRYAEADRALLQFFSRRRAVDLPVEFLSPLVTAAWEAGGLDLGSIVVDRIDNEAPSTRPGLNLRLAGVFQQARLQSLRALFSASVSAEPFEPAIEQRIHGILVDESALLDSEWRYGRPMREICDRFVRWRHGSTAFFPDPSFVLSEALEAAISIVEAVDAKRPLSLVRLGDGEGNFLPYRSEVAAYRQSDRLAVQRSWWGEALPTDDAEFLEKELEEAIRCADVLGLPDLNRICRTMLSHPINAIWGGGREARGLLAVIDFATSIIEQDESAGRCAARMVTSCHIHQSLSYWGLWEMMLPRLGPLSLITCHRALAGVLAERYGATIDTVHLVPPERKYATAFADTLEERHYPFTFESLRAQLSSARDGQVFLVAAGMLGKLYCMWIKQAGGIAIDIGSAADIWCGHHTRNVLEISGYRLPSGVAEHVGRLVSESPRYSRLLRP